MSIIKNNSLLNIDLLIDKIVSSDTNKVADFGCGGFGYFVFPLAKKIGRYGKIYAVDIIKGNLDSIKKTAKMENLTQVETIWSDLETPKSTKLEDGSLNAVLLVGVLHQSNKYENILSEAKRVVGDGGKILVVDWDEIDSPFGVKPENRLSKKDLKKSADDLKLKIVEDFPAGKYHYALLLEK